MVGSHDKMLILIATRKRLEVVKSGKNKDMVVGSHSLGGEVSNEHAK